MIGFIARAVFSGLIIATVAQLAPKLPRVGALILSLPLVSIGAFLMMWYRDKNLTVVAQLSRETIVLVPLGLAFFLPLAFSEKMGISFWFAFVGGILLSTLVIALWFWLGPTKL